MRRGVVFACGGIVGYAWSLLAAHRYEQMTGVDLRRAEILMGTSAGSILATELAAGLSTGELIAQLEATQRAGASAPRSSLPPRPRLRWSSLPLVAAGLRGKVAPHVALFGLVPDGGGDSAMLSRAVDRIVPAGRWVASEHPACLVVAVDCATGERVAFGRAPAPAASAREAVAASCAIPGWCAPVEIGGRRYLDGGLASPTSLDLLAGDHLDEVVVFSPMTSARPAPAGSLPERFERGMRRLMTKTLDREVARVAATGTRVVRFEPTAHELHLMGPNFMDSRRRAQLLDAWQA